MNNKIKLVGALLAATITTTASAGIVTEWGYDNQAGFLAWVGEGNADGTLTASGDSASGSTNIIDSDLDNDVDGDDTSLPTNLAWGTPYLPDNPGGLQSSLDIDSAVVGAGGSLISGGDFADGTSITHNNYTLDGDSDSLQSAFILDALTLTPSAWLYDDMIPSANFAPQLAFGIKFYETPNNDNPCANGEANKQGDNINGCGDIFEITGLAGLGLTPVVGPDFIEFTVPFYLSTGDANWDNTVYYITTRLSGLTVLPNGYQCAESESCFGFVTKEKQANVLQAEFKIRVPEPTTIALFGLGLIATAFAGRRKRNV